MIKINQKTPKIIGVLGGMGPFASSRLLELLLNKSRDCFAARNDEDFPNIIINSLPVPDFISDTSRADFVKNILLERVHKLDKLGCNILGLACNTAHLFYPDLKAQFPGAFHSLIEMVSEKAASLNLRKVLVLSTETTKNTKLYDRALESLDIKIISPEAEFQKLLTIIIKKTISNLPLTKKENELLITRTKQALTKTKADGVILGCTELPLIFPKEIFPNTIDSLDCLADSLLRLYYS